MKQVSVLKSVISAKLGMKIPENVCHATLDMVSLLTENAADARLLDLEMLTRTVSVTMTIESVFSATTGIILIHQTCASKIQLESRGITA
jgi:hypothetical protein